MATVRQAIALQDRMSPVLSRIMKSMSKTIDVMEQMNTASSRGLDASAFASARREISAAERALENLNQEVDDMPASTERVRRGFAGWQAAIVTANQAVQLIQSGIQTLTKATTFADGLTNTASRLKLINDGTQTQLELQQKIYESAQRSRGAYEGTADAVAKLNLLAGNVFASNDEAIAFAETMNKAFAISGADTSSQQAAMQQMSQALASGRLQGDEFTSILENAPMIAKAIENYVGVSRAELREMSSEGLITADIIKAAVFNAASDIEDQFDSMPKTFAQRMQSIENTAIMKVASLTERFNAFVNSATFDSWAAAAETGIGRAVDAAGRFLDQVIALTQTPGFQLLAQDVMIFGSTVWNILTTIGNLAWGIVSGIIENWGMISPILSFAAVMIGGIAAALLVYNTVQAISTGLTAAAAFIANVKAAADFMQAGGTTAAASAQWGLNAALLASPITWIILAIVALIAILVLVVDVINNVTGSTLSVIGIITGAIMAAVAFIWNLFLGLVDYILGIVNYWVNIFTAFANFFGNLFNDPIGSVINLFGSLADNVLGVLETIAKAMDKVFGSNMAGTVAGWRESLGSKVEIATKEFGNGSYEKVMGELNLSSESLGLKRWEYGDAWDTGYDWGANLGNSITGMADSAKKLAEGLGDPKMQEASLAEQFAQTGALNDLNGALGNGVDVSGSTVSLADEDLKYLRDVAEIDYVNQYTTMRPVVQASFGDVRETADVNAIIEVLENAVADAYSSSLARG